MGSSAGGKPVQPPVKPHIPPQLTLALALLVAGRVWLLHTWDSYLIGASPQWAAGALTAAVAMTIAGMAAYRVRTARFARSGGWHRHRKHVVAVCIGITLGVIAAAGASAQWTAAAGTVASGGQPPGLTAELMGDPIPTTFGSRAYATVQARTGSNYDVLVFIGDGDDLLQLDAGDRVSLGRLRKLGQTQRYAFDAGAVAAADATERVAPASGAIARYRVAVRALLPDDSLGSSLIAGLLLGDRGPARESGLDAAFRRAGVSHILAVSGTHLAVIAGLALAAARILKLPRWFTIVATLPAAAMFTLASTSQVSTLRALSMLAVSSWALLSTRRPDPLVALSIGVAALVLIDPFRALSVGLQLSAAAVAGIVLLYRLANYHLRRAATWMPQAVASAAAVSLVAQLGTMPISLMTFGTVPAYSLPANLLVVPLASAALTVGQSAAIASFAAPWVGRLGMGAALWLAEAACMAAGVFSALPGAELVVPEHLQAILAVVVLLMMVALYHLWPIGRRESRGSGVRVRPGSFGVPTSARAVSGAIAVLAGIALACALLLPGASSTGTVEFLDVGQGDAVLIQSGGETALIDTGPEAGTLEGHLALRGIRALDLVVFTHDHADHVGGAAAAFKRTHDGMVVVADGAESSPVYREALSGSGAQVLAVSAGDSVQLGNLKLDIIGPEGPVSDPSANESCLIILVTPAKGADAHRGRQGGVLIGGDAEAPETLSAVRQAQLTSIGVLKVGHHGSADAVSDELLSTLKPRFAVISVGKENRYGHPAPTTIDLLRSRGIPTKRTDQDGSITVRL